MHRLNVDTLTPDLLAGPTYELMRGSCSSLTELEYHLEEVYKATTDQLDWVNPEGQQYPHNLLQPLPLIPNNRGRRVIPFEHFINNDLEYLQGGASSRKYTMSVTKTKAEDYGHIKWIEDLVPRDMWIQQPIYYNKHALWGVSHWGRKRKQFYGYVVNRESARDVYSKRRIIAIYKFKDGDFKRLRLQDIEDMLLLLKKLNLTRPDTYRSDLKRREAYTAYSNPRGFIYQNKDKKNRLMRIDELHKFSDGTLNDVRKALDDRMKGIRMQYLPSTIWRKGDKDRAAAMIQAIEKMLKTRRIMRSLEKFVDYGHIKWIEDLVPREMWIQQAIEYNKHALWGVSHWGRKRKQFYGYVVNRESARDVYSKRRIIAVTELQIMEWNDYKHLDWISVRRDDDQIYKFKEGDFKWLCL
nr:hypothetical protein [Tanacetum cinerariifolium]